VDDKVRQLVALANRIVAMIREDPWPWSPLLAEHSFDTVAGTASYALPTDFYAFLSNTHWNRDRTTETVLCTPMEWQLRKSGLYTTGTIYQRFRVKGRDTAKYYLDPTPTAAETLVFEYKRNTPILLGGTGTTWQQSFTTDTDTTVFSEGLIIAGIRWRWALAKGLDSTQHYKDWLEDLELCKARDGGNSILSLVPRRRDIYSPNVPERDWFV
jgi:hypothetical protein